MSLGEEPVVNQHAPPVNNVMSVQRPINCLPVPPPVSPPVKQNSLNASLTSGNRNLMKSNSVPSRNKIGRCLTKQESFETDNGITLTTQRGNPKVKLLQRSHALREETSPPREADVSTNNSNDKLTASKTVNGTAHNSNSNNLNNSHVNNNSNSNGINNNKIGNLVAQTSNHGFQSGNNLQVTNSISRPNSRHKLRHQGSSQGSMDNPSPCLSRDSSTEQYTDNSGIDLNQFIADTLNRNYKDRMLLLQIEQDLISLVKDAKRAYQKFPVMSSYQRMLVHRVAAFFGMDHNVDQSGHCVVVNVTSSTRIPDVRFSELIREDCRFPEEPRRCILKRDSNSFEEGMQLRDGLSIDSSYRSHDGNARSSHEDLRWQGESQTWSSSDSDISNARGRHINNSRINRISKVESFEGSDTLKANSLKNSVSKSYSFGGYPGMTRGDSIGSSSSRALVKQADSVTSSVSSTRLSPSSSGYKSQSIRSDVTVSTTPSPNQATSQCSFSPEPNTVVWAVSSLTAVPAGAVLINPSSGQPYTNADGSLYRYDPDNPIKLCPTIEEDVSTNAHSSPASGTTESSSDSPQNKLDEKSTVDASTEAVDSESSDKIVTAEKTTTVLINSSTSPSLPESKRNNQNSAKDNRAQPSDSVRAQRKMERSSYPEKTSRNNNNAGQTYSNSLETMSVEVAQTDFNGSESENNISNSNIGGGGNGNVNAATNCQCDAREYSGQNSTMSYQVNYTTHNNVTGASEYGSQSAGNGAYMNSSAGVAPMNCTIGPHYPAESVHMPPEIMYSQPIVYAAGQQPNQYGVIHAPVTNATTGSAPQPVSGPPPAPGPPYDSRPNDGNPTLTVPELSNYFMNLNVGNEHMHSTPQLGYWGPSPNASQTQGSNHSSQIQMYYVPGNLPTGTVHQKYTPAAQSMYTYNVPPVVYPTELCQSMMPSTATPVFPTSYYASASNTTMSYRTPTPPTPTAVTATAMAPTSFFVYHPQPAPPLPPPPPTPIQFGVVRPQQQQIHGIRSSPPPAPRPRLPYNRSISERTRHTSTNADPKSHSLHFSSPLSMYTLRFVPGRYKKLSGEIQSIGMMRPVTNVRPVTAAAVNSNMSHHPIVSHCTGNESILTAPRPPKPRKQR